MEKQKLPNATAVLVLGILSIIGNCCYIIPGFIFGLIAIILSIGDTKKHRENPDLYSNYANLNAGKILAIIGLVLSIIFIGICVYFVMTLGIEAFENEEAMKEALENAFGIKQ
jgi:hypothetical protein